MVRTHPLWEDHVLPTGLEIYFKANMVFRTYSSVSSTQTPEFHNQPQVKTSQEDTVDFWQCTEPSSRRQTMRYLPKCWTVNRKAASWSSVNSQILYWQGLLLLRKENTVEKTFQPEYAVSKTPLLNHSSLATEHNLLCPSGGCWNTLRQERNMDVQSDLCPSDRENL